MRVVSENSELELARKRKEDEVQHALSSVQGALVDLAANILRVTRGAGKSYDLGAQAQAFVGALVAYREVASCFPDGSSLENALSITGDREHLAGLSDEACLEHNAKQTILRGALQVVASKLLGPLPFVRSGEKELHEGIRSLEEVHQERRKRLQAEWQQASRTKKVSKASKTKNPWDL